MVKRMVMAISLIKETADFDGNRPKGGRFARAVDRWEKYLVKATKTWKKWLPILGI